MLELAVCWTNRPDRTDLGFICVILYPDSSEQCLTFLVAELGIVYFQVFGQERINTNFQSNVFRLSLDTHVCYVVDAGSLRWKFWLVLIMCSWDLKRNEDDWGFWWLLFVCLIDWLVWVLALGICSSGWPWIHSAAQAGFEHWSSDLHLLSARITGLCQYAWFKQSKMRRDERQSAGELAGNSKSTWILKIHSVCHTLLMPMSST